MAEATVARDRWTDVVAQVSDPNAPRELDYVTDAGRRGHGFRPLAALVAFVALLAGAFGVASLTGSDGAGSPEAAVEDLFAAISEEDAIGVLQALAPSEREVLVPLLQRFAAELDRLEVSSDELDLQGLDGIDLELSELQLATQPLSDDYAVVEVRSARFRSRFDLTDLPLAEALRGVVLPAAETPAPSSSQVSDLKLVTVREGGGWYVGVQASVARLAEDEAGVPGRPTSPRGGIPERGAASPEEAARQLLDGDLRAGPPADDRAHARVRVGRAPRVGPVDPRGGERGRPGLPAGAPVARPRGRGRRRRGEGRASDGLQDDRRLRRDHRRGRLRRALRDAGAPRPAIRTVPSGAPTACPTPPTRSRPRCRPPTRLTGWGYPLPVAVVEHDGPVVREPRPHPGSRRPGDVRPARCRLGLPCRCGATSATSGPSVRRRCSTPAAWPGPRPTRPARSAGPPTSAAAISCPRTTTVPMAARTSSASGPSVATSTSDRPVRTSARPAPPPWWVPRSQRPTTTTGG